MNILGHYIDGVRIDGTGETAPVWNPATARQSAAVAMATGAEINAALESAAAVFPAWAATTPLRRARVLTRYRELLEANLDPLAELITAENGKTLEDARGEVRRGIEVVEYACGAPDLLKGEHARNVGPGIDSWSAFHPIGVVAGITPFNFPAMVPLWMFPMAIACGNAFVLKPSEKDPSASLMLAQLFSEAGLPKGVFNVLNGGRDAVDALLTDPRVEAISFVGSTAVAQHVYRTGTAHGKRVQALGGAKNHAIVLPDADVDNVVEALMGAAYGSSGERCMAISVAVCVGDAVADAVSARLQAKIATLRVGDGFAPESEMGPLISAAHLDSVSGCIVSGVEEGARLVVDGRRDARTDGYFLGATLFDDVKTQMRIYREEIFGPVLCLVRVNTFAEAIELANAHPYGNGACIFTRDGEAARIFCETIKVGMAGVNVALPVPVAVHSFGGWKKSLYGDLHAYGPDSVRFYTRRKTITQRWPAATAKEAATYSFPSANR